MLDIFRILVIVFLVMHGVGHSIWFLAAWTPVKAGVRDGSWGLPGNVTIRSPLGRLWGLLALVTVVLFAVAALTLLSQDLAWRQWTYLGILLSFITVVPWLRQSPGTTPLNAIVADIILLFLLALPLSEEMVLVG